jgi:hypothetical protein
MTRKRMLVFVPTVLLLIGAGRIALAPVVTRGEDGRIIDAQFRDLEKKLGYHLYAPTWLPYGGRLGEVGATQGRHRVLQDFSDEQGRTLVFVAQEPRSPTRDAYHQRVFQARAEARADVDGKNGYFITGSSGERRLFWNEKDAAVILSSFVLTDGEMVQVARGVR